jgi:hypothetical protein
MNELAEVHGEWVLSQGVRPARSPDFSLCNFDLWDMLKDDLYVNNPHWPRELKENILQEISLIPRQNLPVSRNIF